MTKKKKKKGSQAMPAVSPKLYIREMARLLPIGRCLVSADWKERGLGIVIVTRRHPKGSITIGMYLVDTFCRGVCDTRFHFHVEEEYLDYIINRYYDVERFEEVKYEEAHNLIYGAIAFAREVGIEPCQDFGLTQYILEDDTDDVPLIEYEYGREGKYFLCVPSQWEADRYLPALREHLGDDFEVMIEDDDEEEEEECPWIFGQNTGTDGEYSYQPGEYKQTEELLHPWLQTLLTDPDKEILSHDDLDKILALPHEDLRHDLKQLALYEMGRNVRGEYSSPYNPVISHVFILLGEVGDDESLELLLEMMRQSRDFMEYHVCDASMEIVQPAIYKLAKGCVRKLVDFLEEPGLYNFSRIYVLEVAISRLVCLEPDRKEEATIYARELAEFLLSHADDPKYMDGSFAGFLCNGIIDISAEELIPLIEKLYATGHVDESICGTLKTIKRDFKPGYNGESPLTLDVYKLYDEMKRVFKKS